MTKQEIIQNMYALADKAVRGGVLTIQEASAVNATIIELEQKLTDDSNFIQSEGDIVGDRPKDRG